MINPLTLTRFSGRAGNEKGADAQQTMTRFSVAGCDPARSSFVPSGGGQPRLAQGGP
jgi:hypothetical protein